MHLGEISGDAGTAKVDVRNQGTLEVRGPGVSLMQVRSGGTMTVDSGGRVITRGLYLFGGQVNQLNTATVLVSDDLTSVGSGGLFVDGSSIDQAVVSVRDGGTLTTTGGQIALFGTGHGSVTVADSGSRWTSSLPVYVGGSDSASGGTGKLTVTHVGRPIGRYNS